MRKPWQAPYDDWLVETWLPRDRRLKGSLVVAPQDPEGAAAEIRRLGGHPDIVQVLVSSAASEIAPGTRRIVEVDGGSIVVSGPARRSRIRLCARSYPVTLRTGRLS